MAFGSTHKALKAEDILNEASVNFKLLPAPKALEPYCDLVISIREGDIERVRETLEKAGVMPKNIYSKEGDEYVKV
ncbi:MAG: DUF3343 domain-containing protein [Deltaproteobacteria bacterium]|nr:DUF3343 domain-containing protein [Deltaproteobacteria bacterium]